MPHFVSGAETPVGIALERLVRDYVAVMTNSKDSTSKSAASDHWSIVASVCIDFCTSINRLDLLFGPVYDSFASVEATTVLLLSLEPFIRIVKLGTLSPVVMKGFVEAHTATGALGRVEKSLLSLDLR